MKALFPPGAPIVGEKAEKDFISLWGSILKMRNILAAFDEFVGKDVLPDRERQDYQSVYLDMYGKYRELKKVEKESITDDIVFEMELVRQVDVNIDYILMLVEKYRGEQGKDKEIKAAIDKAVGSSLELRSKRELIEAFLDEVNATSGSIADQWMAFVRERKRRDIMALVERERLKADETVAFFEGALRDGVLKTTGTEIDAILPPLSRFGSVRQETKSRVMDELQTLFDRYRGISDIEDVG